MLTRQEQIRILSEILEYSDALWIVDLEDANSHADLDINHVEYVLDLGYGDQQRSDLCEKYQENLNAHRDHNGVLEDFSDEHEFFEEITGSREYDVPGMLYVLPAGADSSESPRKSITEYAAAHDVTVDDIWVVPN